MNIENDKVVVLEYVVKDESGEILAQSNDSSIVQYIHGQQMLIPALESALSGKKSGDEFELHLAPEKAFGVYNEELVVNLPADVLENYIALEPGKLIEIESEKGVSVVRVKRLGKINVTVDGNHPWAGKTLSFKIKILNVRNPEEGELESFKLNPYLAPQAKNTAGLKLVE